LTEDVHSRTIRLLGTGCIAISFLTVLFLTFFPVQNNDVWWILSAGREMIRSGRFLSTDVFSCTINGRPWMNKYAPFEILSFLVYSSGGADALVAMRSFLVSIIVLLLACIPLIWRKRKIQLLFHPLLLSFTIFLAGIMLSPRMYIRPELFSLVFFTGAILVWESRSNRPLGVLVPACLLVIQILWTNSHSAFVLGYLLAFVYLGERIFFSKCSGRGELLILPGLILASLVNPFGFRMILGVADVMMVTFHHNLLQEWQPLFSRKYPHPFRWIVLGGAALALPGFFLNRSKARPAHIVLFLVTLFFTMKSRRHVGFLAVSTAVASLWNYGVILEGLKKPLSRTLVGAAALGLFLVPALFNSLVMGGRFFPLFGIDRPFGFGEEKSRLPWDSCDFMESEKLEGNLFHGYDSGGFLIWRLNPRIRTSIDGRAEPFPSSLVRRHWRIIVGEEAPGPFLDKHGITLALVDFDDGHLLRSFREGKDWALCHVGYRAALFLKRTPEHGTIIREYEIPDSREGEEGPLESLILPPPEELKSSMPYADYPVMVRRRIFMLRNLNLIDTAEHQRQEYIRFLKKRSEQ